MLRRARIDAGVAAKSVDRRKFGRKCFADGSARIETDESPALLLSEDCARDDVARRKFGVGMDREHEAFAQIIEQYRAFAANRFAD